ncbi:signal peptide containing protein [Theileria equi strain WA]|uniref:GTPase Der n=1 Tax=Theileria equi strain WA TaxID=1537102 RepID=L1LDU3_THEEQ|nr:signal peptide containing protein [Theileria equi strain WA]EKX73313.1 signal peptide containing protein [Theileria equi strain WA]|eukprot:XP_004832765.1 signal peptide containing protein [Theileria equi strain WA]
MSIYTLGVCITAVFIAVGLSSGFLHPNSRFRPQNGKIIKENKLKSTYHGINRGNNGLSPSFFVNKANPEDSTCTFAEDPEYDSETKLNIQELPVLALVGRPNVGKSSIFNRITKLFHRGSIVSEVAGTTRDRQYSVADWNGKYFRVVDTGGFDKDEQYSEPIKRQIDEAIVEASVIVIVVDAQEGMNVGDTEIRDYLFKVLQNRPDVKIVLCVNKCESYRIGNVLAEQFWKLGLGKPYPISALHGNGLADLLDACVENFQDGQLEEDNDIFVSFVGRPNCGKSSLVNRIFGKDRCIVSPDEGTTRDSTQVSIIHDGQKITLVDTAGMKLLTKDRRSYLSQKSSLKSIRASDVCIMVIDSSWGISKNELKIAEEIRNENKPCIIVCNKWDLIDKDPYVYKNAVKYVREKMHSLSYAEILLTSAKSGQRVDNIMQLVHEIYKQYCTNLSTTLINEVLKEALFTQKPPATHGKRLNIYYACQAHSRPPGIVLFCNDERLLTDDYKEYLEFFFRKSFGLTGTPIMWYPRARRPRNIIPDLRKRKPDFDTKSLLTL